MLLFGNQKKCKDFRLLTLCRQRLEKWAQSDEILESVETADNLEVASIHAVFFMLLKRW